MLSVNGDAVTSHGDIGRYNCDIMRIQSWLRSVSHPRRLTVLQLSLLGTFKWIQNSDDAGYNGHGIISNEAKMGNLNANRFCGFTI